MIGPAFLVREIHRFAAAAAALIERPLASRIGEFLALAIPCLAAGSLAVALAVPALGAAGEPGGFDAEEAFARSQSAIGVQLDDHRFVDTRGRSVGLADLRGRPLVMSLVYTSCPDTCTVVTRNLARTVREAREALGEGSFSVATVGFDHRFDTPEQMRMYADRQGVSMSDWSFLSGDPATIGGLLDQLGFTWTESPRGYDHLAQTTVVDGQGRVYRQIYGDSIAVPFLVEPLKEIALGRPAGPSVLGDWIERVRLLCTVYDPNAGRYRFDFVAAGVGVLCLGAVGVFSIFVAAGVGVLCLGAVGVFIVRAWRDGGRARHSA